MAVHAFMLGCVFLLCLWVFVPKCILETRQHFCIIWLHSSWPFQFSHFLLAPSWGELAENHFTVMDNVFQKKMFVHPLGLRWNFIAGTKWAVPSRWYQCILPPQVANHSAEFVSSCLLKELFITKIIIIIFIITT